MILNTDTQVSQDSHFAKRGHKNSVNDVSTAENQSPVQSEHKYQNSHQQPQVSQTANSAGGNSVLETQTAIQLEEIESLIEENQSLMDEKEESRLRVSRRDRSLEELQVQTDQLTEEHANYQKCRHQPLECGRRDTRQEADASNKNHNQRLSQFCTKVPPKHKAGGDPQQTSSSVGEEAIHASPLNQ